MLYFVRSNTLALSQMDQDEVRMVPEFPTTTNCEPDQATPIRTSEVLECWAVQVRPSGEVRMVPESPTATNCEPDQATPRRFCEVPECWACQTLNVTA